MQGAFLSQRAVISLSGEDTVEFLQGLISNDAHLLSGNNPVYAALLSPQGRFLHDFFLIPWQGRIFIDVRLDRLDDLLARLKAYRLRSKVEIEIDESVSVAALWEKDGFPRDAGNDGFYKIYQDPRLPDLGFRAIGIRDIISDFFGRHSFELVPEEEYEFFRLSLCVPATRDMVVGKSLLMECGFEQLNGVDFSKGCYVGQEVTARSKFRGQVRKSFYSVKADGTLPVPGTQVMAGEKAIGEMRTSLGSIGIALVYNDEYAVAESEKKMFSCAGIMVTLEAAKWIKNSK